MREKAEPPQRLTVTEESEATTGVQDVRKAADAVTVARLPPRVLETEFVPAAPAVPEDGAPPVDAIGAIEVPRSGPASDALVRLAFSKRSEGAAAAQDEATDAPIAGSAVGAPVESYVGNPVMTHSIEDTMERTDLPTPTKLAKASETTATPDVPLHAPTSVVGYLSMPNKSSDWIKVFIKNFYLSGDALEESDLRRIYSHKVEYFGKPQTSIDEVAREKALYYREWPDRHYELVPDSIAIKWKSAHIADVSFTYLYKVSAPDKGTGKGRGRAHLTLDLRGHTGLIIREDGEVIAHN